MKNNQTTNYQLPTTLSQPKVAIVHDWLVGGGAERVVEELHTLYPEAPIYTSYCSDEWRRRLHGKVVTGWLQHFGSIRKFLPLARIWWFSRLNLSEYDLIISSSGNGEAKGVKTREDATHIVYCHAPTHFYWRFYKHYLKNPGFGFFNPVARLGLRILVKPLRSWDYKAAQRPDFFIANSSHIQSEIKEFYGRNSVVIHPPIDTARFSRISSKPSQPRNGFITASRQVPQKKFDLIIGACNELKLPLTVIGRGPEHNNLLKIAGDTISFRTNVTDEEMPHLFAAAEAFIFAAYEDFGVTPVEALAAGTPVIAYKKGGALDYIQPGNNGEFFDVQSVPSLCTALQKFDARTYSERTVRSSAEKFSDQVFRDSFKRFVKTVIERKT